MAPPDVVRTMRGSAVFPWVLLLAGGALVADAVLRGGASVALVVVFPVFFGGSAEFFLGVVLLFFGVVTLPLAFGYSFETDTSEPSRPPHATAPPSEVGGLILVGPVPIFFGRWRGVSRRTRIAAAAAGGALLVLLVVVLLWLR